MDARMESVLDDAVAAVTALTDATLSRLWLSRPGDLCATCAMAPECPDRTRCLHLVRSDGITRRLDGPFRRFPFGAREVGRVATALEPRVIRGGLAASGLADPEWLARHGLASFGAWPLVADGHCLAVLAVFSPRDLSDADTRAVEALLRLAAAAMTAAMAGEPPRASAGKVAAPEATAASMADVQRAAILAALERAGGRVSGPGGAAEILGMRSTTLESRIRKLGVRKPPRLLLRRG